MSSHKGRAFAHLWDPQTRGERARLGSICRQLVAARVPKKEIPISRINPCGLLATPIPLQDKIERSLLIYCPFGLAFSGILRV